MSSDELSISRKNFIGYKTEPVTRKYTVQKKLGDGNYGQVFQVINKSNGLTYAMKQIPKSKV